MTMLSDLTVVDASSGLAGAVATMLLADAGACVIKVEPPGSDPLHPSPGFATWDRDKRAVVLGLGAAGDREALDTLLAEADVFVHSLTPQRAAAAQLDDGALAVRFPKLVVAAVTGYPPGHPDAERDGYDILIQARSGLMDEQIVDRPGPGFSRIPLPSWGAAYLATIGILARLHTRARTGRGGRAHTSLLQGALPCLATIWNDAERPSPRMQQKLPLPKRASPNAFLCADGAWIQCNAFYPTVPLVTETTVDLGLSLPPDDVDPVAKSDAYRPAFRQRTSGEWLAACWSADVSAQPVLAFGELLRDEQALANGYTTEVEDATWGRVRQVGTPWTTTRAPSTPTAAGRGDEPHYAATASAPVYPLEGLKVLDFGSFVGGPFGPTLLAQLGADVIKVEPKTGDRMRLDDLIFAGTQAGKRTIALDLKASGVRPVLERLIRWADVVHLNVRSQSLRGLGLDYDSVRALNPAVVHCHVSGFGPGGDRASLPVFDPEMQALSGWLRANAGPSKPPAMVRCAPTDVFGAMLSLVPTLVALVEQESTGEGAAIEASILGATLLVASETMLRLDREELVPVPSVDDGRRGLDAGYRIYETADGWVAVAAITESERTAMVAALGAEDVDGLDECFRLRPTEDVVRALERACVPVEPVRTEQERTFLRDPDNLRCGIAVRHRHPIYGDIGQFGALWSFGDLLTRLDRPAPTLGQHSREILTELGLPDDEIRQLAAAGLVVGDALL